MSTDKDNQFEPSIDSAHAQPPATCESIIVGEQRYKLKAFGIPNVLSEFGYKQNLSVAPFSSKELWVDKRWTQVQQDLSWWLPTKYYPFSLINKRYFENLWTESGNVATWYTRSKCCDKLLCNTALVRGDGKLLSPVKTRTQSNSFVTKYQDMKDDIANGRLAAVVKDDSTNSKYLCGVTDNIWIYGLQNKHCSDALIRMFKSLKTVA